MVNYCTVTLISTYTIMYLMYHIDLIILYSTVFPMVDNERVDKRKIFIKSIAVVLL
jgi:hypothetical protein